FSAVQAQDLLSVELGPVPLKLAGENTMAQQLTEPSSLPSRSATDLTDRPASFVPLVGRVLLSMIFLASGVMKFVNWQETAGFMASKGMVAVGFFLTAAALVELSGGLSVLFGCKARLGALALFLFLIPVTLLFHNFWVFEGMERMNQMQHFMKNLAIMGGLLLIVGLGAGPFSFDARTEQRGSCLSG